MLTLVSIMLAVMVCGAVCATMLAFDPREWRGRHTGTPIQVLTLGSAHLAQLHKPVTPQILKPLLDKLTSLPLRTLTDGWGTPKSALSCSRREKAQQCIMKGLNMDCTATNFLKACRDRNMEES